jgi:hypothetical protein
MEPLIGAWLLREAIKLVWPVAEEGWDAFVGGIGTRIGEEGADLAVSWIRKALEAPDQVDEVTSELQQDPQVASALSAELGRQIGVQLTSDRAGTLPSAGTDEYILEAYAAVFWRLAVLAYVEDHPIAVCGALQGSDWITVCRPYSGLAIGTPDPPSPDDIWLPSNSKMLRRQEDVNWRRADFYVKKHVPLDAVPAEVASLNRAFRRGDPLPCHDATAPLEARWHRVDGVAGVWVQLKPDDAANKFMKEHGARVAELNNPPYRIYPPEWQPLLDIPDEVAGLTLLDRCADEFSKASARLRAKVNAILQGRPNASTDG